MVRLGIIRFAAWPSSFLGVKKVVSGCFRRVGSCSGGVWRRCVWQPWADVSNRWHGCWRKRSRIGVKLDRHGRTCHGLWGAGTVESRLCWSEDQTGRRSERWVRFWRKFPHCGASILLEPKSELILPTAAPMMWMIKLVSRLGRGTGVLLIFEISFYFIQLVTSFFKNW